MEKRRNFHNIFNISLTSGVKLYNHLWNMVVRFIFSSILQIWYVEVRISRSISEGSLDFEITRVDCISNLCWKSAFSEAMTRSTFDCTLLIKFIYVLHFSIPDIMKRVQSNLELLVVQNPRLPLQEWWMPSQDIRRKTRRCLPGKYVIDYWRRMCVPQKMYQVLAQ